jgi:hypothetical protein
MQKILFLHFLFFIFFVSCLLFFYIFFLGWAQLSWIQPARRGHWPKQVTRLGPNQQEARVHHAQ